MKYGIRLPIDSIVYKENLPAFVKTAVLDRFYLLEDYKAFLKVQLDKERITVEDYNMAIYTINNSPDPLNITDFVVTIEYIEVIVPCVFPHSISDLEPDCIIKYEWNSFGKNLNEGFKEKLKN